MRGIDDIVGYPERIGANWQLVVEDLGGDSDEEALATLQANPDIAVRRRRQASRG